MKKFSTLLKKVELKESIGMNPGNQMSLGLTNHWTPIDNIITNVNNLFGLQYGLVVRKGSDNVSLTITSSQFGDTEETAQRYLYSCVCGGKYLAQYIQEQGLNQVSLIQTGNAEFVFRFYANDINNGSCDAEVAAMGASACDMDANTSCCESELSRSINEDEEEMEDTTAREFAEIINTDDKIKAAQDFADKVATKMELPENLYFKATKDTDGNQSIALRYKYEVPRPFNKKQETVVSLMNFYKTGDDAVWVGAYINTQQWDEDILQLIDNLLKLVDAHETSNKYVYSIGSTMDDDKDNEESTEENTVPDPEDLNDDENNGGE